MSGSGTSGSGTDSGNPLADDEQRRTSFGTTIDAARYDELRPGYPAEAVTWLLGGRTEPLQVLDLAAGTGKLTRALARLGHAVVAVDPSEGMLAAMHRRLAGADFAGRVRVVAGTAEAIPLPDASVDAVTIGSAWHWMRPASASAEIARVLRPGGTLGLAWNARDTSVPWSRAVEELAEGPADPSGAGVGPRGGDWWPRVSEPLTGAERAEFPDAQTMSSPQEVAALASTYSGIAVRPDRDQVLARVRELAAAAAGPDGTVTVPLVCRCFRYRRA